MMFCPKCGAEYRDGFLDCSDCQVSLVRHAPSRENVSEEPKEHLELVTVLEAMNPIQLTLAKSILEGAGIAYLIQGESSHILGGIGFVGSRRPARIQVDQSEEESAKDLLANIDEQTR